MLIARQPRDHETFLLVTRYERRGSTCADGCTIPVNGNGRHERRCPDPPTNFSLGRRISAVGRSGGAARRLLRTEVHGMQASSV
jgi:hypothetical protein